MSTRTKYILQGLFFLILSVVCLITYVKGNSSSIRKFTLAGTVFSLFIGILFLKNGLKK